MEKKTLVNTFKRLRINEGQIFVLGFMAVILLGSVLLMLPISSKSRIWTDFITALFTATSATCVTGLVVVDTYSYWSSFGHVVILLMIQLGGLGFMTLVSMFVLLSKKTLGLKSRLIMIRSFNMSQLEGIGVITKRALLGTAIIEGMGAVILSIRFSRDFGLLRGIAKGIFCSVSAFCNAGFDLMGQIEPFSSMSSYVSDHSVNVTIMLLITMGGLGFWVWNDIYKAKKLKYLSVHTKIVLISSAVLILGGTGLFFLWEHSNDATLGLLSHGDKVIAAMFQSITARTAGFNTISQTGLTEQSRALTIILMIIGGSPGSTAGGIKTVTVAVLLLGAYASLKGKHDVSLMGRRINPTYIMNALALLMVATIIITASASVISTIESIPFGDVLYETSSAFGTVGISMGITPTLGAVSRIILIFIMFMGRIGVLTMGYIVLARKRDRANIEYPDVNLMIG